MAGKAKEKEKETKRGSRGANIRGGGSDETDTSDQADLLAVLADQVVKEEKKKLKPGIKSRKKGKGTKKKISECVLYRFFPSSLVMIFNACCLLVTVRRTLGRPDELEALEKFNQSQN